MTRKHWQAVSVNRNRSVYRGAIARQYALKSPLLLMQRHLLCHLALHKELRIEQEWCSHVLLRVFVCAPAPKHLNVLAHQLVIVPRDDQAL